MTQQTGAVCLGFALLALGTGAAQAQVITEFSAGITAGAEIGGITAGPDGNLWFADYLGRIGRITPLGVVTEFSAGITAGAGPQDITAGPDGNLWFTETYFDLGTQSYVVKIGRITPFGIITEFSAGMTAGFGPQGITAGPDGNLWFTEQGYPGIGLDRIGRITPLGVVTEFSAGITAGAEISGITAGPDGNLWFTEGAVGAGRIGRITPLGVVTEFSTGITALPFGITAGPDGNLWFTEGFGHNLPYGQIGRITPLGVVTEFTEGFPAGASLAGITAGPDGNLWFAAGYYLGIGRITPFGVVTLFSTLPADGPGDITTGPDGNLWVTQYNAIGRITTGVNCNIDGTTLCLSSGRFKVQAHWATSDGQSGDGQAISLTSDTGYFWFFSPSNVEMVIKVLSGCVINSQFWVFAGGLTNVQVDLTVTDTLTNTVKTYRNPQNTAFLPIQDTSAFATCSAGFASLLPNLDGERAAAPSPVEKNVLSEMVLPPISTGVSQGCTADTTTLCLSSGRFGVQAQWATSDGQGGDGQAISMTSDRGYFWFFSSSNVEMVVKVLDGCNINGSKWVFAGGLTNVNVVLTVTDTQTGAVRTYTNPQTTAFQPIQDTNTFSTCP